MRTWWRSLLMGMEPARLRRPAGLYVSDRALRIAAEVLEPRCLLSGDIVVPASAWDDGGLTLSRNGDWVHLVHTGTTQPVIPAFLASSSGSLIIQGRNDASDVLTIDLSGVTYRRGEDDAPMLLAKELLFMAGDGIGTDELRLSGQPFPGYFSTEFRLSDRDRDSWIMMNYGADSRSGSGQLDLRFRHVEVVSRLFHGRGPDYVSFGAEDNDVTVDYAASSAFASVSERTF